MEKKKLREEKNKVFIKFGLIFIAIIVLVFFGIYYFIGKSFNLLGDKKEIYAYVNENVEGLEAFASNMNVNSFSLNFDFITNIYKYCNDDVCYVKFPIGGRGFGPSGCYDGFYYSYEDVIQKYGYNDWIIVGDNINKYFIKDSNKESDNFALIEKIRDHWYYYEECY